MMQGPLAPASLMTLQYHIFQSLFIPDHPDPEEKTCPLLLNLIKVYQHYSPPPLGSSGLTNVRIIYVRGVFLRLILSTVFYLSFWNFLLSVSKWKPAMGGT